MSDKKSWPEPYSFRAGSVRTISAGWGVVIYGKAEAEALEQVAEMARNKKRAIGGEIIGCNEMVAALMALDAGREGRE